MNVLSLFDGISCGQVALNRAGIKYENYFASEINQSSMKVTQHNYPNTIQLGDVTTISSDNLPKIDLLMGGSPCTGFSQAGKQLNFSDSQSKLFFEYVRLLNELQPKYFLLENVKMKKQWENIITEACGVEPIEINSSLVSAQNRKRLYWTNVPNVSLPKDKNIMFNKMLHRRGHGYITFKIDFFKKFPTLMACDAGTFYKVIIDYDKAVNMDISLVHKDKTVSRSLTPEECEELQTLPVGYTSILSNKHKRYEGIGNGWTVDVIAHIFKHIK